MPDEPQPVVEPEPVVEPQKSAEPAASADPQVIEATRKRNAELEVSLAFERAEKQKLIDAKAAEERKRLEEEGKWKELADKESQRADQAHRQSDERVRALDERILTAELKARLALEGVRDLDFHVLADRSKLKIVDGQVQGLDDCVTDLKSRKPTIFGPAVAATSTSAAQPAPADRGAGVTPPAVKDVSKMSPEEYRAYKKQTVRELSRRRA